MRLRRRSGLGFTIIEILISIVVITIAIFGTVAAIAFGLRASDLGKTNTFAIGANRKVLELILGGNYQLPNAKFTAAALTAADLTKAKGATPWRPLYFTGGAIVNDWFKVADFGYNDLTLPEAKKFMLESPNYELHVFITNLSSSPTSVDSRVRQIFVTTRWRDKTGWKNIQTQAFN